MEAKQAFTQGGANIGQVWGTTGLLLNRNDSKWKYHLPKEGALTWVDSLGIPSGAKNIDQAYAFINHQFTPEQGALMAKNTGYNSAVQGAPKKAGEEYRKQFAAVYTAAALQNLWWYPPYPLWYRSVEQEYIDKITNS